MNKPSFVKYFYKMNVFCSVPVISIFLYIFLATQLVRTSFMACNKCHVLCTELIMLSTLICYVDYV